MSSTEPTPVAREYGRLAPHYDLRWSSYIEATVRETLRRVELHGGERVLDVGCGTGVLLKSISAFVPEDHLSGVDPSPAMLEIARKRLGAAVDLKESGAERLPFGDQAFDVVVSTNAFHYFPRPLEALTEMARVVRPFGRLVITDWCDDFVACRLCDIYLRFFNRAHMRSYGEKDCRRLLEQGGFVVRGVDRYKINWLWGLMTAVAERRAAQRLISARSRHLLRGSSS